MPYHVKFDETKYVEGRRGVTAHAKIRKDGHVVATIADTPEQIVVPVTFTVPSEREPFLAAAKEHLVADSVQTFSRNGPMADDTYISEYARQLIGDSEIEFTSKGKK